MFCQNKPVVLPLRVLSNLNLPARSDVIASLLGAHQLGLRHVRACLFILCVICTGASVGRAQSSRILEPRGANARAGAAQSTAAPQVSNLLWAQNYDGQSVFGPSVKTRAGTPAQDEELVDDFDVAGTIERVVIYGYRDFNAAPNAVVHGAWVRFYANVAGQPGALQAEQYLATGDARLVVNSQQPLTVDITLPTPFPATGKHFLSVQLDVQTADSYWWWASANTGALRGSPVLRRDRATSSAWTVKNNSDAALALYGTLTGAPRLDSLSTQTATRSGYVVASGANFGGQQGTGGVLVNNVPAIVVRWTDTAIQFYVPETAGPGSTSVQVVSSTGGSNALPLDVTTRTQDGRVRWRFTVAAEYTSFRNGVSPDGTVYVNDVYGRVYALTPDGGLKWVTQVALTGADGPVSVGPDNTIYVAGLVANNPGGQTVNAPGIIALNPDGTIKWRFVADSGQSNRGGPNVGPDGKIYAIVRPLSDTALNVFALNPNGTLAWNFNDQIYKYGQTGGKDIVFGRTVPQLYFQYDSRSFGTNVLFSFGLDGSLHWTRPAGVGQTVVSPLDDSIHTETQAFTPPGPRLWAFPLFGQGPTTGPDVGVDGVHYVVQNYGTLFAINPDGTEKWRHLDQILSDPIASPANNIVFAGGIITYGEAGFFVGHNTADGAEVFRVPLPTEPGFEPYGQVRPDTRPTFSPDGATAYSGADVAGSGYADDPNRRFSFFYAIDTTTNLACSYGIAPQTQAFPANGGNGTVAVTPTSATCAWTATSNVSWIIINSGASGTGNGTVAYAVAANTGPDARTGTLTIAGRTFTVTQPGTPVTAPQVALTYPADNAVFTLPTSVFVRADAAPAPGRTLNRVEFYAGNNLIGTDTSAPYQIAWDNPFGGNNVLTAKAFDNQGGVNTSQPINIRLDPPTGPGPLPLPIPKPTLNSPQQNATFTAPATITISATPAASQYPVVRIEFYADTTLVGSDTSAPYSVSWTNVPPGRYTVSARTVANTGARASSNFADITVTAQSFNINGRVMDSNGAALSGVGVTLTNGVTNMNVTTDVAGNYSFNGVTGGSNYTVAAAANGLTFNPGTATFNNLSSNQTADFNVVRPSVANGSLLISEFRLRGPGGSADEFVELYNNTAASITITAVDNSQGWAVVSLADEALRFTIPNGTTIPAHGLYLAVNSNGYSLAGQSAGDKLFTADLPDNTGLALFRTSDPQQFTTANALDAVGFSGTATAQYGALAAVYREGTPLAPAASIGVGQLEQYSFVRKLTSGLPQDTGDNAQDFLLVSPTGTVGGASVVLGAPSPENMASPLQRNAQLKAALIDPQQSSTAVPNRVRDTTANVCGNANCALGTLTIRRRFTNKTGQLVTALRFRIVDITTLNSPNAGGTQADLRGLDSSDAVVTTSSGTLTVKGTIVEQPPVQDFGGGLNSALVVALPGGALAPNASIPLQFTLGVQQGGSFRFLVNVEALTGASMSAAPPKSGQLLLKQPRN